MNNHSYLSDFVDIIKDDSFKDNETKLEHYIKKFPLHITEHPMSLVYCCAQSDDINECIKLIYIISKYHDHAIVQQDSVKILNMIDSIISTCGHSNLEVIYETEKSFLEIVLSIPVIFFKACNERETFNRDQLEVMLSYRDKVKNEEMSQHDASVDIGTVLVDEYVKNKY